MKSTYVGTRPANMGDIRCQFAPASDSTKNFIGQGHYAKVKGQIKVILQHCTPTTPNQSPYKVLTSWTLRFPRYSPDKIWGQVHRNVLKYKYFVNFQVQV